MKKCIFFLTFIFFLSSIFSSSSKSEKFFSSNSFLSKKSRVIPQRVKKPKYDYMSTFLSRNTKPLGLKENPVLKKYMNQPTIKWAIRAGERHILN